MIILYNILQFSLFMVIWFQSSVRFSKQYLFCLGKPSVREWKLDPHNCQNCLKRTTRD